MTRDEAIAKLTPFVGRDLVPLSAEHRVAIFKNDNKNKGWAGQLLERILGKPLDNAQAPDFGTWDLKIVSAKRDTLGKWQVKEPVAITMLDPANVIATPFEHSHLLDKIRALLLAAREWVDEKEPRSALLKVATFDIGDGETFQQVQADYEAVQKTLRAEGPGGLSGWMGNLVQPRTKGPGGAVKTHAFYARTGFVARMLKF